MWFWLYLLMAGSFTAGWVVAATFARRGSGRDLCGRADCVYCAPYERRRPEIPPGVVVLKNSTLDPRVRRASSN